MRELNVIHREILDVEDKIEVAREKGQDVAQLEAQKAKLVREFEDAEREAKAVTAQMQRENAMPKKNSKKAFREMLKAAKQQGGMEIVLREGEASTGIFKNPANAGEKNNIAAAGAVPTSIKALLPALQNSLVYDKLGIEIATGVKGQIVWPVLAAGTTVTIAGEGVEVGDSKIDFDKVEATPKRIAVTTTITNEALDNSSFDVEAVVVQNLNDALAQALNNAVLASADSVFDSPFQKSGIQTQTIAGSTPTFAELMAMKGKVAKGNVQMKAPAFVMNNETYAALEATQKGNGLNMVVENGKIGAYPVLVTEAATKVGFGDWSYAALNNVGETRLIIDPYTLAASGKIKITLDSHWSLSTLRKEAFCLGSK